MHQGRRENSLQSKESGGRSWETWGAQDLPVLLHNRRVGQSSSRSPREIAREISPVLIISNNLCRCYHAFVSYGSLAKAVIMVIPNRLLQFIGSGDEDGVAGYTSGTSAPHDTRLGLTPPSQHPPTQYLQGTGTAGQKGQDTLSHGHSPAPTTTPLLHPPPLSPFWP